MEKINFVDLSKQYTPIKDEINNAIQNVIDNTSFILEKEVSDFERNFADFCTTKYCVGIGSGTDALYLALKSLGIGPGDEVITAANTFIATALAISHCSAKPVLVDCKPDVYTIDVDKIEKAITDKTKAIIPVHLYGQPADMDPILELAEKYSLAVVEDACQAHGAEYKGRKTGCLGKIGCFSFYPGKNLGAYGDGGAVVTNDEEIAERIKLLRNYGEKVKYHHSIKGFNTRLDSIQASVLNVKLKYLEEWNELRRKNAKLYSSRLDRAEILLPIEEKFAKHVYHLYVIRTKKRNELQEFLKQKGIDTGIHYPVPIHLQEAYLEFGNMQGKFPVTEKVSNEILSLPMYPELSREEIEYVADCIKSFSENGCIKTML